ncbi:MAG: DUF1501 domain-containing protein, partial [Planctomycetota bacterium]
MRAEELSAQGRRFLDRRGFLSTAGLSTASLALCGLLDGDGLLAEDSTASVSGEAPIRPKI